MAEPAPGHPRAGGGRPGPQARSSERLAATADVDYLPGASVTRLATALVFLGRHDTGTATYGGPKRRTAMIPGSTPTLTRADGLRPSRRGYPVFRRRRGHQSASGPALKGLAKALLLSGQSSEAADIFRELTRLRSDDALCTSPGSALRPGRSACGGRRVRRSPPIEARKLGGPRPDCGRGSDRGDWTAAVEEQRE